MAGKQMLQLSITEIYTKDFDVEKIKGVPIDVDIEQLYMRYINGDIEHFTSDDYDFSISETHALRKELKIKTCPAISSIEKLLSSLIEKYSHFSDSREEVYNLHLRAEILMNSLKKSYEHSIPVEVDELCYTIEDAGNYCSRCNMLGDNGCESKMCKVDCPETEYYIAAKKVHGYMINANTDLNNLLMAAINIKGDYLCERSYKKSIFKTYDAASEFVKKEEIRMCYK